MATKVAPGIFAVDTPYEAGRKAAVSGAARHSNPHDDRRYADNSVDEKIRVETAAQWYRGFDSVNGATQNANLDELTSADEQTKGIYRRWKIAENQISESLRRFGLELHVDPDGNYSVVNTSTK